MSAAEVVYSDGWGSSHNGRCPRCLVWLNGGPGPRERTQTRYAEGEMTLVYCFDCGEEAKAEEESVTCFCADPHAPKTFLCPRCEVSR